MADRTDDKRVTWKHALAEATGNSLPKQKPGYVPPGLMRVKYKPRNGKKEKPLELA